MSNIKQNRGTHRGWVVDFIAISSILIPQGLNPIVLKTNTTSFQNESGIKHNGPQDLIQIQTVGLIHVGICLRI